MIRGLACAVTLVLLVGSSPAIAKDGETRVDGTCSGGASSKLRPRARDGSIGVEFEVLRRGPSDAWRVVLVHERQVEWRGSVRTSGSSGSFRIRRTVDDFDGPDQVALRASGPRGITCRATATVAG